MDVGISKEMNMLEQRSLKVEWAKRAVAKFMVFVLCVMSIQGTLLSAKIVKADGPGDMNMIFYATDIMYQKTIDDVSNESLGDSGLAGATINILKNGQKLNFLDSGAGYYNLTNSPIGAETDITTDADGRIEVRGLDKSATDYQVVLTEADAPAGFFCPQPSNRNVTIQKKVTGQSGEPDIWYTMYQYTAREMIMRAKKGDGTLLNGINIAFRFASLREDAEFIKIADGIYRQALAHENGVTTLVTANVEGQDGVVLIHGIEPSVPFVQAANKANDGFYVGKHFPVTWRQAPKNLPNPSQVRIDCGEAIFYVDTYDPTSIPLPAPLVGYGEWKINPSMSDEFDGEILDQTKWRTGHYVSNPAHSSIEDGYLKLVQDLNSAGTGIDAGGIWANDISMLYGYFECRMRTSYMPSTANFWMMSQGEHHKDVEIDVCENRAASKLEPSGGLDRLNNMNAHYPNLIDELAWYTPSTSMGRSELLPDGKSATEDFITYGVLWEPGKVTYYAEDQVMYVINRDYASPMGVIVDVYNRANLTDYTVAEFADLHNGFPINTTLVDYIRAWTREDITYQPQEKYRGDDDHITTLPKTPQIDVPGNWVLKQERSDEFDDDEISKTLWGKFYSGEAEAYETLRLAREVYDPYNGENQFPATGIATVDNYINDNNRNEWVDSHWVATNSQLGAPYRDGYYEFRAQISENSSNNNIVLQTPNQASKIHFKMVGDPVQNDGQKGKVYITVSDTDTGTLATTEVLLADGGDGYHLYSVLRKQGTITIYVDGQEVYTSAFNEYGGLNIRMEVDEDPQKNGIDSYERLTDGRDNNFYIDYVRYYQTTSVQPVSTTINGVTTLDGVAAENGAFDFELSYVETNITAPVISNAAVSNTASGAIEFGPIKFTEAGTYTFKVTEVAGSNPLIGYDTKEYVVTIEVEENAIGTELLIKSQTTTLNGNAENIEFMNITNTLTATEVDIAGTKTLDGNAPAAGAFDFAIAFDAAASTSGLTAPTINPSTVSNDGSGDFSFEDIELAEEGTYVFEITETHGGDPGIKYDNRVYTVTIVVAKNQAGTALEVISEVITLAGTPVTDILFENETEVPNSAETARQVRKTWDDANDQDGKRPTTIQVQLYADGVAYDGPSGGEGLVTLSEANNWHHLWLGLPEKTPGDVLIDYTVQEVGVPAEYTATIVYDSSMFTFNITNTYSPETVNVAGTKTWNDANDQDGKRPASITVRLLANGTEIDAVTVGATEGWAYSWANLDAYENGVAIVYTVTEDPVSDYTTTYQGYDITNDYTPGETGRTVTKVWIDGNNQDGMRPSAINVQLYADGVAEGAAVELNEGNGWSCTWTGLPEYDGAVLIDYTVQELNIPVDYAVSYSADTFAITNTYAPEKVTINGTKTWDDENDKDGIRPIAIIVRLYADGVEIATETVTETGHWQYEFANLPKYAGGVEINYTIDEDAVAGYETTINGYDITNKHEPAPSNEVVIKTVNKVWNDNDDKAGKRPTEIKVQLLADGVAYGSEVALNKANNWTYTWTNLPKENGGQEVVYTVKEVAVSQGYKVSYSGDTFTITNTYENPTPNPSPTTPTPTPTPTPADKATTTPTPTPAAATVRAVPNQASNSTGGNNGGSGVNGGTTGSGGSGSSGSSTGAKTGDTTQSFVLVLLMAIAGVAVTTLLTKKRKTR